MSGLTLRTGIERDLGFQSPSELLRDLGLPATPEFRAAFDGAPAPDELTYRLMRSYLAAPALYFFRPQEVELTDSAG